MTTQNPARAGLCAASLRPNAPAVNAAGAFSGMDENRERELLRAIPRLRCAGEVDGFRWWLGETGEKPTGPVEAALVVQAGRVR